MAPPPIPGSTFPFGTFAAELINRGGYNQALDFWWPGVDDVFNHSVNLLHYIGGKHQYKVH